MIVDNGSTDDTLRVAAELAAGHPGSGRASTEASARAWRPVVRAFSRARAALEPHPDVIVKVDADVSMAPDYFERLLAEFAAIPRSESQAAAWSS